MRLIALLGLVLLVLFSAVGCTVRAKLRVTNETNVYGSLEVERVGELE